MFDPEDTYAGFISDYAPFESSYPTLDESNISKLNFVNGMFMACMPAIKRRIDQNAHLIDIDQYKRLIVGFIGSPHRISSDPILNKIQIPESLTTHELVQTASNLFFPIPGNLSSIFGLNTHLLNDVANQQGLLSDSIKINAFQNFIGELTQAYFVKIDTMLEEDRIVAIEQAMRDQINYINGDPSQPRQNTMVMINGHSSAGKGTTLKMLGTHAVETGTDGILGRGEGFELYEYVTTAYDPARFIRKYLPSKIMRLMFAAEALHQRQQMDLQGRQNEAVFVSGIPRDVSQVKPFEGINQLASITLEITPQEAVSRTLFRISDALLAGKAPRPDDLSELEPNQEQPAEIDLTTLISQLNAVHVDLQTQDRQDRYNLIRQQVANLYQIRRQGSRYEKYDYALAQIKTALKAAGIKTSVIDCNGSSAEQIAQRVKLIINQTNPHA